LLFKDIYGSFVFCFSIPIFWQVAYLNKPLSSLGIKAKSLLVSVGLGIFSGVALGLIGGNVLKFFDLTNYAIDSTQKLGFAIGAAKVEFALARELGYILLVASSSIKGLLLYFLFNVLVVGLGEELFWRGFVQQKIARRTTKLVSIWTTSGLFAAIHFYLFIILPFAQSSTLLCLIAIAGIVWGFLFEKTDSIWSVAISHGITSAIIWKYFFGVA